MQGAHENLMEAARHLLQAEHYQAVVEERSLDGLCGYPPCNRPTQALPAQKRWSVNYSSREVISAEEVRKYCGPECRRQSCRFCTSLQPDPVYIRPDSAVVCSQEAIASSKPQADQADQASRADGASIEPKQVDEAKPQEERSVPKVRPRAVVRFSRTQQVYTVHYQDYDGGGALPDVAPVKDEPRPPRNGRLLGSLVRERPREEAPLATDKAEQKVCSQEPEPLGSDALDDSASAETVPGRVLPLANARRASLPSDRSGTPGW